MSMSRPRRQVKGVRRYDASRRQGRAREAHAATLDAARELFLAQGYAATTVESIADGAGVSAATVYKSYGGKGGLLRELCHRALAGRGPIPAEQRSNALRTAPDPRQVIEGWGKLTTEVAPRIAPLLLLLRDAARADPEAGALYDELDAERLARMADNARYLASTGQLRVGATEARDLMWLCTSPELYDLFINRRRWSVPKYSRFIVDTVTHTLLRPD